LSQLKSSFKTGSAKSNSEEEPVVEILNERAEKMKDGENLISQLEGVVHGTESEPASRLSFNVD